MRNVPSTPASGRYLSFAEREEIALLRAAGEGVRSIAMESWFALLEKNVLDRHRWRSRDQLRIAIVTWTERTYHRRRRQIRLGKLTPIEFETTMTETATQAA